MCQEIGVSLMSPGSSGHQVLPLEMMRVGKPMYALASLGIIMAEPRTYVGVGGGPSLQPLSVYVTREAASLWPLLWMH